MIKLSSLIKEASPDHSNDRDMVVGVAEIIKMVKDFVVTHQNAHAFTSLGQLRYLSCIAQVDGVIGNCSGLWLGRWFRRHARFCRKRRD